MNFIIKEWTVFSDHAGLYFSLKLKNHRFYNINEGNSSKCDNATKIVWDESKVDLFRSSILNDICKTYSGNYCDLSIDNQVTSLTELLHINALSTFGKHSRHNGKHTQNHARPKWFNENCYNAKKILKKQEMHF